MKGYYFVTDTKLSRAGNVSDVQNAVAAGVQVVQYRRKAASTAELFAEAVVLRKLCHRTLFLVNDRVDIALAVQADGVHLGISPIFTTQTKADAGRPAGIQLIRQIKRAVKIPLVAIGGINLANAPEVVQSGADGLCAISAVVSREDVRGEIEKFQRIFG